MSYELIKNIIINDKNLNKMMLTIKKNNEYNIKKLLGVSLLTQSQSIKFGKVFEQIVKDIASNAGAEIIYEQFFDVYNTGSKKIKGKKDADCLIKYNNILYYFECKTNCNLNSEKSSETDKKIKDIKNYFNHQLEKYKCNNLITGCVTCWYEKEYKLPNKLKTNIFFMKDIFNMFNINISKNEYYDIMKQFGKRITK